MKYAKTLVNVVMEARSHGLEQKRMHGLNLNVATFTNLTQDHLDFHADFEHYFAAKKSYLTVKMEVSHKLLS